MSRASPPNVYRASCYIQHRWEPSPASPIHDTTLTCYASNGCRPLFDVCIDALQHGAPAAPAALELEAISGPCKGSAFTKSGAVLTVGRTKARDIHIKDSAVSERHAELRWQKSKWTLTDVGSSNGTVLNGRKLR